jgi:hypothetical protein
LLILEQGYKQGANMASQTNEQAFEAAIRKTPMRYFFGKNGKKRG